MADGGLTDILDELKDLAGSEDEISVGNVVEKLGHRSTGVFLLVPGLVGMSPLGGIPTVPTLMAVIVIVLAAQIALGRSDMWLPGILRDRSVDGERLKTTIGKSRGVARKLDDWFGGRLERLTGDVANRAAAVICILLAGLAPPLEVVPFAAALPMAGIATFGLALTLRDGAVMLGAFTLSVAALWGAWAMMP